MNAVRALLAYLNGLESHRDRAAARLFGSPYRLRLHYVSGHPGIWEPESFWIGRVGGRLRLVDEQGQRTFDMELSRILGLTCSQAGHLFLRYEPTPGLITSVEFRADQPDSYHQLLRLMALSA